MLRYKTETRTGLVALYDIQPGNGTGQFLQPRSPHGASDHKQSQKCVSVHYCASATAVTSDLGKYTTDGQFYN